MAGSETKPSRNIIVCINRNPVLQQFLHDGESQAHNLPTGKTHRPDNEDGSRMGFCSHPLACQGRELSESWFQKWNQRIIGIVYDMSAFPCMISLFAKKLPSSAINPGWIQNIKQILYLCGTLPACLRVSPKTTVENNV